MAEQRLNPTGACQTGRVIPLDLGHFLGFDGAHWYNFWSGAGADLGQLAILGAAIGLYRKHNCHVHRCWRIGKSQIDGTPWVVCHKHHPAGKPTQTHMDALKQAQLDKVKRPDATDRSDPAT